MPYRWLVATQSPAVDVPVILGRMKPLCLALAVGWNGRGSVDADQPTHFFCEREQITERGASIERRPDGGKGNRLWLIGERQEGDAGSRQQCRRCPDDGNAEALSDHG